MVQVQPTTIGSTAAAADDGKTLDHHSELKSLLWWILYAPPPAQTEEEAREADELQPKGDAEAGPKGAEANKVALHLNWMGELVGVLHTVSVVWLAPALFVAVQMTTFALTGGRESFFGMVTGGVVESLTLDTGVIMRWHMFSASLMWALGAAQFLLKSLRHGPLAWVHRFSGRLLLMLWFTIAGPSAFYLSLYSGTGPSNAQVAMTGFSVVSMETTVLATYYLWKGWNVARRRTLGDATWKLHRKAMGTGIAFTMTILFQRPLQLILIVTRKALVVAAYASPESWTLLRWVVDALANSLLDHNVNLAATTCVFGGAIPLTLDGPRSRLFMFMLDLDRESAEELFQDQRPSWIELALWRSRLPLYILMRAWVTNWWTSDPNPAAL